MKASSFLKIGVNIYAVRNMYKVIHYLLRCWKHRERMFFLPNRTQVLITPIFKKLDAFIPALSLLLPTFVIALICFMYHKAQSNNKRHYQPLCVSFYYIYIVNVYISVCIIFTEFHWRQFSKSWTSSFLPYPCSLPFTALLHLFCCPK